MRVALLVFMTACGPACGPAVPPPDEPQPAPTQPPIVTSTLVVTPAPGPYVVAPEEGPPYVVTPERAPLSLDQPPEIKLRLGHYSNPRRGIGAVIDRTEKEAKVRFDGTNEILRGYPEHGPFGRIDYMRNVSSFLMHVYEDGRITVYVPGAREGIDLFRDGDAEPLSQEMP